ncbi:copper ABC transporter permease [Halobacteriales archaeon QH_2_65_14]|nr:MAG: copper ABC transporter permease [Halobacteriales archaeon QH_2_65_14]
MNWLTIARRDFTDARRSKILALAIGLFVALVAVVLGTSSTSGPDASENALWTIHGIAIWLMPIVILVIGYLSIAGERETGRIKYLLGLPNTRWEVILGKFLSRSVVSVLAVVLSMGIGGILLLALYPSFPVGKLAAMTAAMAVFAVVYTAIAVGVSALTASRARAMGSVIGIYVFFTVYWIVPQVNPINSISYVVENLLGLPEQENLYEFIFHLSPSFAYSRLVNGTIFERVENGATLPGTDAPFYLQEWFMPFILLGWVVLMLGVGYLRFRDAELG